MSRSPEFALLPTSGLKIHEQIVPARVREIRKEIERTRRVEEPILVARETGVILNGHHRYAALKELGATKIPAWVVEYDDERVLLGRWEEGPEISKEEVVRRAHAGTPFGPKTTKHQILHDLPHRPTPLDELLPSGDGRTRRRRAQPGRSSRPGTDVSGS